MAYVSDNYTPNKNSRKILDRAWTHVQSVPYQVTARWLFYRLLQEGYYRKKNDYCKFLQLMSRVRHNQYGPWLPDTLADDRREPIYRGTGFDTPEAWARDVASTLHCSLHRWEGQEYYVEVWFEAGAMKSQFQFYTQDIILRPFYGMPSIPYKYSIADDLAYRQDRYGLPIVVLYFGDWDDGGQVIPETSTDDIRKWCAVDFEFIRAGLNPGDEVRYNIPENFEKPGSYQWEALDDESAKELITGAVSQYVDYDAMRVRARQAAEATRKVREFMRGFTL